MYVCTYVCLFVCKYVWSRGGGGVGVWGGVMGFGQWANKVENKGFEGQEDQRDGRGGWGVGTLVLGGPISIGVSSGGGAPWLGTMRGVPPALINTLTRPRGLNVENNGNIPCKCFKIIISMSEISIKFRSICICSII